MSKKTHKTRNNPFFQKFKNMVKDVALKSLGFRPLTVQLLAELVEQKRSHVPIYTLQTFDGKLLDEADGAALKRSAPDYWFWPSGTLIRRDNNDRSKEVRTSNWLRRKGSQGGPYGPKDKDSSVYYYLEGCSRSSERGPCEVVNLQICSDPLNVLSEDCGDEVNCWVREPVAVSTEIKEKTLDFPLPETEISLRPSKDAKSAASLHRVPTTKVTSEPLIYFLWDETKPDDILPLYSPNGWTLRSIVKACQDTVTSLYEKEIPDLYEEQEIGSIDIVHFDPATKRVTLSVTFD